MALLALLGSGASGSQNNQQSGGNWATNLINAIPGGSQFLQNANAPAGPQIGSNQPMMQLAQPYTIQVTAAQRALMISILQQVPQSRPDVGQGGKAITADEHKTLMKALQSVVDAANKAYNDGNLTLEESRVIVQNVRWVMMIAERFAQAYDIDDDTRSGLWGILIFLALGLAAAIGIYGWKNPSALANLTIIVLNGMKALLAIGSVVVAGFIGYWFVTELDKNKWDPAATIAEIIADILSGIVEALWDLIKNLVSDVGSGLESASADSEGNMEWYDYFILPLSLAYVVGRYDGDITTTAQKAARVAISPNVVGTRGWKGLLDTLLAMPETGGTINVNPQRDLAEQQQRRPQQGGQQPGGQQQPSGQQPAQQPGGQQPSGQQQVKTASSGQQLGPGVIRY